MWRVLLPFIALAVLSANAQPTPQDDSLQSSLFEENEKPPFTDLERPNEITVGSVSYSGIAIQAVKLQTFTQLFSPVAPTSYGEGEYNLVRDPIQKTVSGLKIFSIDF